MAALTKSGTPSLATPTPGREHIISGLYAGEAIAAGDACYIKSDGLVWKSTGAAANAAAEVDGFAMGAAAVGEAVSLYHGVHMAYATAMTPGTRYFLSGTVTGGLDTVASTGGTKWIAKALDATRLFVRASSY